MHRFAEVSVFVEMSVARWSVTKAPQGACPASCSGGRPHVAPWALRLRGEHRQALLDESAAKRCAAHA